MKGKKFTAAEKHFLGEKEKYEKQIKILNEGNDQIRIQRDKLSSANNKLTEENIQLKNWVERLLQYTELSIEDIKSACEKDKNQTKALQSFTQLMGFMNYI